LDLICLFVKLVVFFFARRWDNRCNAILYAVMPRIIHHGVRNYRWDSITWSSHSESNVSPTELMGQLLKKKAQVCINCRQNREKTTETLRWTLNFSTQMYDNKKMKTYNYKMFVYNNKLLMKGRQTVITYQIIYLLVLTPMFTFWFKLICFSLKNSLYIMYFFRLVDTILVSL